MIDIISLKQEFENYKSKINELKKALHIEKNTQEKEELEAIAGQNDFWNDSEKFTPKFKAVL